MSDTNPDTTVNDRAGDTSLVHPNQAKPLVLIGLHNHGRDYETVLDALDARLPGHRKYLDVQVVDSNRMMIELRKAIDGTSHNLAMVMIDGPNDFSDAGDVNLPSGKILQERQRGGLKNTYVAFSDSSNKHMGTLVKKGFLDGYFVGEAKPHRFDQFAEFLAGKVKDGRLIRREEEIGRVAG